MFRRLKSVIIATAITLPLSPSQPIAADTIAEKEIRLAEKVKTEIIKLGVGREARIKLKLKDKTKVDGYLQGFITGVQNFDAAHDDALKWIVAFR